MLKISAILCAVVLLASCGGYYTSDIAGYVKDDENGLGVNGAIIRVYAEEPESADAEGFSVETASMTSGGNAGYYSHKIIWKNWFPSFGEEGDSGSVWIGITHDDYIETTRLVQGILSETVNVVPDVYLTRASFSSPEVSGVIIDVGGNGVNGVRTVLDLESTVDDQEDYVTVTATVDGVDGVFQFEDVRWRDESPDSPSADTENAVISVADADYETDDIVPVIITSDQASRVTTEVVVTRQPRIIFSGNLYGRCIRRYLSSQDVQEIPAQGIEVTLTYIDEMGEHLLYDYTDASGTFAFFVQWIDSVPGNFDGTAAVDTLDPTIPDGEDGIFAQVFFDPPFDVATYGGDIDGGDPLTFDDQDFALKSWINPNYLPDTVLETSL